MLLASSATVLFTTGLVIYDYFQKKKLEGNSSEQKDKKRNYQTIKILLTGGPYIYAHLDAEEKVKESTASITPSKE